jgi:uncharacterized protein (TIGR02453 family)
MAARFAGFPRESLEFFSQIAAHNNRDWFLAHKDVYERACRAPMQSLLSELEPRFGKAKISRINRDIRFSRNKEPYKTYIAAGVAGSYISLSPQGLFVGSGFRHADPGRLARFRAAIADDKAGRRLQTIVAALRRKGYEVGAHETLKAAPRGYAADHPRIALLKTKDIFAGRLFAPAAWLQTAKARERVVRVMTDTRPLVAWLHEHVA